MKRRDLWPAAVAAAVLLAISNVSYAQYGAGPPPGRGGPGGGGPSGGPGGRGFGRGGGFGGFGGRRGGFGMLRMPEVQKELNLSKSQVERIEKLRPPNRGGQDFRSMSEDQRRKAFDQMRVDREKQIAAILDPKQMARYRQLQLQRMGYNALGTPEVAGRLKLTADQRGRVRKAMDANRDAMRKIGEGMPRGGQPPTPEQGRKFFEQFQKQRTATDNALKAVLTPTQRTQFQAMLGKPFKFPEFGRGGFGRRGGPGRQGAPGRPGAPGGAPGRPAGTRA